MRTRNNIQPERKKQKVADLSTATMFYERKENDETSSISPPVYPVVSNREAAIQKDNSLCLFLAPTIKRFKDGASPIKYKETHIDGQPPSTDVVSKSIKTREKALTPKLASDILEDGYLTPTSKVYGGLLLERDRSDSNKWVIKDNSSEKCCPPDPGKEFIFVTMPDQTIRISTRSKDSHLSLAEYSNCIRYAGEIWFDEQQRIQHWTNRSTAYCPPPCLALQANLGVSLSEARLDRNDCNKQATPIFSTHILGRK